MVRYMGLRLNVRKCMAMSVNNKSSSDFLYNLGLVNLNYVNVVKDLGISFNNDLNFDHHISNIIKTAYKMLGLIKKNFIYLNVEAFLCLYKSQVRSHLEYGVHVWSPWKVKDVERLEKVQKWATKIVRGCECLKYDERLKFLGLPTLVYRRVRGDMIMVYNILNVYECGVGPGLTLKNETRTRGHSKCLQKGLFKTNWKNMDFVIGL